MNHIVKRLKSDLNWYDETHSSDRHELIEATKERFRLICKEYNANGEYIIDGYAVGYGNLEINKNMYGLIKIIESRIMETKNSTLIEGFQKDMSVSEKQFQYSFLNTAIPAALRDFGSDKEIMENIAIYGACHITLNQTIMSTLVNTHTMLMATLYCGYLDTEDYSFEDDLPSIFDVLKQYYSTESVLV